MGGTRDKTRPAQLGRGARVGVVAALAVWAAALFGWREAFQQAIAVHRGVLASATCWFLLNAYLWLVPSWRQSSVERRGPLLGFGFAFAAAFVSAVVDGIDRGALEGLALFAWRMGLLAAPFAAALRVGKRPYPHLLDALVVAYALLLPHLPGFGGLWWRAPDAGSVLGMRADGIGPGHLAAAALLTTYFYAVRPWSAAPLDGVARPGDVGRAAAGAVLAAALAAAAGAASGPGALHGLPEATQGWLAWLLVGAGYAAFVEELVMRGILLPGLRHGLPKGVPRSKAVDAVLVAGVALCHAALGSYGLGAAGAFGLSIAVGAVNSRAPRFLPAYLAHAAALGALAAALRFV